ncbi:hypothetical protein [Nocardioides sp. SYSU D00065]|uniref:hypothetical protein n=1 Tax=Nocardioides sp. SYSU D00065 TaxID=2817378 RepID=UPI001B330871|nr:hypothetical protein [Nocardioides sp. SYSU D00065]
MTTILLLLLLTAGIASLVDYVRHDRFAGPASTRHPIDDLGPVDVRRHLVPRG